MISTSLADIFKRNALKNSLLPNVVPADVHARLFAVVETDPEYRVRVDLASQKLSAIFRASKPISLYTKTVAPAR